MIFSVHEGSMGSSLYDLPMHVPHLHPRLCLPSEAKQLILRDTTVDSKHAACREAFYPIRARHKLNPRLIRQSCVCKYLMVA